jgi:hypothetical protein
MVSTKLMLFFYFFISFLITKTAVCHPSKKRKERERFDHVILSLLEVGHQIKPSSNVV